MILGMEDLLMLVLISSTEKVRRLLYMEVVLRRGRTLKTLQSNKHTAKHKFKVMAADIGLWQMMQEPKTPRTTSRKDYISALWSEYKSEQVQIRYTSIH